MAGLAFFAPTYTGQTSDCGVTWTVDFTYVFQGD